MKYPHPFIRTTLSVLLGVLLVGPAEAQEIPASHQQAARQLIDIMNLQESLDQSIDVMMQAQIEQNPTLLPFEDVMRAFLGKYMNMEHLGDRYAAIYAEVFTEQEIRELIAFYQTETGRKSAELTPLLMSRGGALGQEIVQEHMAELEQMLVQRALELEEEGAAQATSLFDVYAPPAGTPLSALVEGTWDWEHAENSCSDNPHTIRFSEDGKAMTLSYAQPITGADGAERTQFRYEILSQGSNHIRAAMEHEVRRTAEGNLVVWDLVLTSPDAYCWRQTDWDESACAQPVVRCK